MTEVRNQTFTVRCLDMLGFMLQLNLRAYLSAPLKGSRHDRGCAVDITLYDLKTGKEITMPSNHDEFTERAHQDYKGGTPEQRKTSDLLRTAMKAEGFTVYQNEWWHFDYSGWEAYPIMNQPL